jgi:hypothetical protein
MEPPERINGYNVVEYGYFPRPMLPVGYTPTARWASAAAAGSELGNLHR